METVCMKRQILFSRKNNNKKNFNLLFAESADSLVSVN